MIEWDTQHLRSLLFVPGSDERKLAKSATLGADVVVIDLEDAVAEESKVGARDTSRAAIATYGANIVVAARVNGVASGLLDDDVAAVVTRGLDAIMVPKVEELDSLRYADTIIAAAEQDAGLAVGSIRLFVLIETPLGLTRCESLLVGAPARTVAAAFGAGDFATELGVDLTPDATEILYARSRIVVASRAAGLAAPIDGPWLWLDDMNGLETDSVRSRQLGFQGRVTLHPSQVKSVIRTYSALNDEEAAQARRVVGAFERAEKDGVASLRIDGRFVDYPIYRLARERLFRYDAWRADSEVAE